MTPFEGRGRGSPGFRGNRGGGGSRGRGGPSPGFRGRGGASPGNFRGGGRGGSFRGSPAFRGRGRGRGGRGGGFGTPGDKKKVWPHGRLDGVFIEKGKSESLCTKSLVPGVKVYGEKRTVQEENGEKVEYRVWNPFRSKLAASILGGIGQIFIQPGSKVLYLGAASGTTVSHVSDIVGPEGKVYAVEFSHRCGRDLMAVAQRQRNIIPIVLDARQPLKYRMVIWGMVDVIFSDVAQPDQARILALNAEMFLKTGGHYVIAIKASCIDSSAPPEAVFANEVKKLKEERLKPIEQVTLEPFERDHCVINGVYRPDEMGQGPTPKKKIKLENEE